MSSTPASPLQMELDFPISSPKSRTIFPGTIPMEVDLPFVHLFEIDEILNTLIIKFYSYLAGTKSIHSLTSLIINHLQSHSIPPSIFFAHLSTKTKHALGSYLVLHGYMCAKGLGTTKNTHLAFNAYHEAATRNDAYGAFFLARLLPASGRPATSINDQLKFQWYKRAAVLGSHRAQYRVAGCYLKGLGTAKHSRKAFLWYYISAKNGTANAMNRLGCAYFQGIGTPQNPQKAVYWFGKAAEQGSASGQCNVAYEYMRGVSIARDLNKSFYWFLKSAERGIAEAMYRTAKARQGGVGCDRDIFESLKWYRKAFQSGSVKAKPGLNSLFRDRR